MKLEIEIKTVNDIPLTKNGKLLRIVSEIK